MRKVIFLAVDGVLNSEQNQQLNEDRGLFEPKDIILDENSLEALKYIVDKTNAEIVLSSSWRYPDENDEFSAKENLIEQLNQYGLTIEDEIKLSVFADKSEEISEYILENQDVEHCLILDFDMELEKEYILRPYWVYIDPVYGLMDKHIEDSVAILEYYKIDHDFYTQNINKQILFNKIDNTEILQDYELELILENCYNAETENELKLQLKTLIRRDNESMNRNFYERVIRLEFTDADFRFDIIKLLDEVIEEQENYHFYEIYDEE